MDILSSGGSILTRAFLEGWQDDEEIRPEVAKLMQFEKDEVEDGDVEVFETVVLRRDAHCFNVKVVDATNKDGRKFPELVAFLGQKACDHIRKNIRLRAKRIKVRVNIVTLPHPKTKAVISLEEKYYVDPS